MKKCILFVVIFLFCSCSQPTPVFDEITPKHTEIPSPSNTPMPTNTPGPSNTPTATYTPEPTQTPRPTRTPRPTNTPEGPKYGTRDNPYFIGETAVLTQANKRTFVIGLSEILRGSAALEFVQDANQFNDPPPDGMEFIVAKVSVNYMPGGEGLLGLDEQVWSVVTKGRIFGRWDKPEDPCCIEPEVDFLMFPGGESFGYMAWPVYEDDPDPMLAFGLSSDAKKGWYFSLQPSTNSSPQPRPTPFEVKEKKVLPENPELGSIHAPYPINEPANLIKGGDLEFQVSVLSILRGYDAMYFIQQANQFNDPPPEGFEFVVVNAYVQYSGSDVGILELSEEHWNVVTQGRVFDRWGKVSDPCCLEPPFELTLLSGGEGQGYMAWPIHQDDPNPLLVFGLDSDGDKGWFFSLTE